MRVKCISKNMKESTQNKLVLFSDPLINWDVEIGVIYKVYGISLWKNELAYLIISISSDSNGLPDWYPAELFEVINGELPAPIYFRFFVDDERGVNALCGYQEMVTDYNHYVDLMERDDHALEIFFSRKKEYDEQEND